MTERPSFKQRVVAALPRPLADRLRASASDRHRRALEARLVDAPERFAKAYERYWTDGTVPADAGDLLFLATWASAGELPRSLARRHGRGFDPNAYGGFTDDVLSAIDVAAAARDVEENGYWVAPFKLADDVVSDILAVLEHGPADPRGDQLGEVLPGPPAPTAPTWWMRPADALRSDAVRRVLRERRLIDVAARYLGTDPMIMSVVLWESFAWGSADKRSAQEFHYDNDRPSFIKMFVYLTDVDLETGPHTYVPRSHRAKPKELLHGERLSDEEVAAHYPREDWAVITGERGTVFFADTQGFHKGGRLIDGKRAMFQVNLASDRFGVPEAPIGPPSSAPSDLRPLVDAAPRYFSQLFAADVAVP